MSASLTQGQIVDYPYLWLWQAEQGRHHGEKARPVCLSIIIEDKKQGIHHLILLPISSTPPRKDQETLEIPALELRRAGLSNTKQGWITVSEYNYDILEKSFHFDPRKAPRGSFSRSFLDQINAKFRQTLQTKSGKVDRMK
jgi:hypothetical protein